MTEHRIGTQEEWQAKRNELLKEQKELTHCSDELARKRREPPGFRSTRSTDSRPVVSIQAGFTRKGA